MVNFTFQMFNRHNDLLLMYSFLRVNWPSLELEPEEANASKEMGTAAW